MQVQGWAMEQVGKPLVRHTRTVDHLADDRVLVEVRGCGICHTDLGFLYDGVPVRGGLPLVLGHEIAGVVAKTGPGATGWLGKAVVVPAVLPCGDCDPCRRGRPGICKKQLFPGSDVHGGFASHVVVPARGLCEVPAGLTGKLPILSVVADAVTTPLNAVVRSGLRPGDLALFVGVGGIGAFGVQIAKAEGAHVMALDVDDDRLSLCQRHGADATFNVTGKTAQELKKELRAAAKQRGFPDAEWKIFETSGTAAGQQTAFSLLNFGATLMVVGFAPADATVRLSNLMAFEARAEGVWGCPPELYGKALALLDTGAVTLEPFIEIHPMSEINELLGALHDRRLRTRVVLTPDF